MAECVQQCAAAARSERHRASCSGEAQGEALAAAQAALLASIGPLVRHVLMPKASWHPEHYRGKAVVASVLRHLLTCCHALPAAKWSTTWAGVGGTYWLSRLVKDQQPGVRQQAFSLLAALALPPPTHAMLQQGWPECGALACRVAADGGDSPEVWAAALRVVVAALGHPLPAAGGGSAASAFRPPCWLAAPAMQQQTTLWEAVLQAAQVRGSAD